MMAMVWPRKQSISGRGSDSNISSCCQSWSRATGNFGLGIRRAEVFMAASRRVVGFAVRQGWDRWLALGISPADQAARNSAFSEHVVCDAALTPERRVRAPATAPVRTMDNSL